MSAIDHLQQLKTHLLEDKILLAETEYGSGLIGKTNAFLKEEFDSMLMNSTPFVMISNDAMVNQCLDQPSDLIWDLIDTESKSLCIRTKASKKIEQPNLAEDQNADFLFLVQGKLLDLSRKLNQPLIFHKLENKDYHAHTLNKSSNKEVIAIQSSLKTGKMVELKKLKISHNGEIEILK